MILQCIRFIFSGEDASSQENLLFTLYCHAKRKLYVSKNTRIYGTILLYLKTNLRKESFDFYRALSFIQWQININILFGRLVGMYFSDGDARMSRQH